MTWMRIANIYQISGDFSEKRFDNIDKCEIAQFLFLMEACLSLYILFV